MTLEEALSFANENRHSCPVPSQCQTCAALKVLAEAARSGEVPTRLLVNLHNQLSPREHVHLDAAGNLNIRNTTACAQAEIIALLKTKEQNLDEIRASIEALKGTPLASSDFLAGIDRVLQKLDSLKAPDATPLDA